MPYTYNIISKRDSGMQFLGQVYAVLHGECWPVSRSPRQKLFLMRRSGADRFGCPDLWALLMHMTSHNRKLKSNVLKANYDQFLIIQGISICKM